MTIPKETNLTDEEKARIACSGKAPSLRNLIEEHGLVAGNETDIYFGQQASDYIKSTLTPRD